MTMLTISQLARRSGMPASTLRYYEKVGVIPPATRSDSGYRLYDEKALARLAFVQRAKALGVDLGDLADLVRLWDGAECAPVQDRLRGLVHEQRAATRGRLEELSQLAADLDAVSATIGDAACGPDCPCVQPIASAPVELPLDRCGVHAEQWGGTRAAGRVAQAARSSRLGRGAARRRTADLRQ